MKIEEVERFAALAKDISTYTDLEAFLGEVTIRLGFTFFSLSHHVSDPLAANVANVTNLPEELRQRSIEKLRHGSSPLPALSKNSIAGFTWTDEITADLSRDVLAEIEQAYQVFDVGACFIVPANLPDAICGAIRFHVRLDEVLPVRMFPHAQYLGALAYDASMRMAKSNTFPSSAPPDLTARQLDCLMLVARGKGDWEIGRLLEISKETVHKHIQAAMKRYNVTTRTQLVVRALYRSQISFDDVLN